MLRLFKRRRSISTRAIVIRLSTRSNILDLVMTNERGMVDLILHESPLGKSDHSVLVIKFILCYAELCSNE